MKKRKRNALTLKQKIEIIKKIEDGVAINLIMKDYNIAKSTIYQIKKAKETLIEHKEVHVM